MIGSFLRRMTRRVHLYLGLLIWPFVLLFAITGLSFNHPTVGRGFAVHRIAATDVKRLTGFAGWQPSHVAEGVVDALNARMPGHRLDSKASVDFDGWPLFVASTAAGKQVLLVRLSDGSTTVTEHVQSPQEADAPFAGQFELDAFDTRALAQRLAPLLHATGAPATGSLRVHPRAHPTVRFVLLDAQGKRWNAVYDLSDGSLVGKPSESTPAGALIERLEAVHTQHHYPAFRNVTSFWALCADITALTLIVWAVTGLSMWWQMRNLRKGGLVVIALAVLGATCIVLGTMRHLEFAPTANAEP